MTEMQKLYLQDLDNLLDELVEGLQPALDAVKELQVELKKDPVDWAAVNQLATIKFGKVLGPIHGMPSLLLEANARIANAPLIMQAEEPR
jgi:hypothetical protein